MKSINSDLRNLVLKHGTKGIILLLFLSYGFFSFIVNLIDLVAEPDQPVFGGSWGVFLFSCGMTSVWIKWPYGHRS